MTSIVTLGTSGLTRANTFKEITNQEQAGNSLS